MQNKVYLIIISIVISIITIGCSKEIKWNQSFRAGIQIVVEVSSQGNSEIDKENTALIKRNIDKILQDVGIDEQKRIILVTGERRITVQLPYERDLQRFVRLLSFPPLELKLVDDDTLKAAGFPMYVGFEEQYLFLDKFKNKIPSDSEILFELVPTINPMDMIFKPYVVKRKPLLVAKVVSAAVEVYEWGDSSILIKFNERDAKAFEQITDEYVKRRLAMMVNNKIFAIPEINEIISGGEVQLTGKFTLPETKDIVSIIKTHNIPVPVKIVESGRLTNNLWEGAK